MIYEIELLELCDYDTDLFLSIRNIFEQQYSGANSEKEKDILSKFIDRYPEVLDYEFDDQWKEFKLRHKPKNPEWFV